MKKALKTAALMLCAATMMSMVVSCDSNESKTAQCEKVAAEYKATLDQSNTIIAERIDTIVQKVFYLDPNQEDYGTNPINNIVMHDYATNETKSLLPETERLNDYLLWGELVEDAEEPSFNHCYSMDYRGSELMGDRLFFVIHTECSFEMETALLFYVNVLDNSLHFVAICDDAKFDKEKGEIAVHTELMKMAGAEDLELNYTLSASLSDAEYAAIREEKEEIANQMSEKWREENCE